MILKHETKKNSNFKKYLRLPGLKREKEKKKQNVDKN